LDAIAADRARDTARIEEQAHRYDRSEARERGRARANAPVCANCDMRGYIEGTRCLYCGDDASAGKSHVARLEQRAEAPPAGLRIEPSHHVGRVLGVR
jgi:hypothetical protein